MKLRVGHIFSKTSWIFYNEKLMNQGLTMSTQLHTDIRLRFLRLSTKIEYLQMLRSDHRELVNS